MSILTREPPGRVESLDEVFAIADAIEHEAATRYAELAARMRGDGNPALAEVFDRLAAEERGHVGTVARWAERESGHAPDPRHLRWDLSGTFDDEGASAAAPALLTAYGALSMAVRNEERAFAFWTYVAANAPSDEIRHAAERMAREELEHVSLLRRERRRAYHAQRSSAPAQAERRGPAADLAALERELADRLGRAAAKAEPAEAARLLAAAQESREIAEELARQPLPAAEERAAAADVPDAPLALAEFLVDRYLEAAERIRDEAALGHAQGFAGRAIRRLAVLRADLPVLAPR